jgi:hypothetical protein
MRCRRYAAEVRNFKTDASGNQLLPLMQNWENYDQTHLTRSTCRDIPSLSVNRNWSGSVGCDKNRQFSIRRQLYRAVFTTSVNFEPKPTS